MENLFSFDLKTDRHIDMQT